MKTPVRSFLILLLIAAAALPASGQKTKIVSMRLIVAPNISPFIADWREDPTMVYLVIDNIGGAEIPRARVTIEITGIKYDRVVDAQSLEFSIPANGSVRLSANDRLLDTKSVVFHGDVDKRVTASNRIDDDQYTICAELFELPDETSLARICSNFEIRAASAPFLLQPEDGAVITTKYPVFQWIPSRTINRIDALYTLTVRPVRETQSPQQSFESASVTIFQKSGLTFPTVMMGTEAIELDDGQSYVWQVQAFDRSGKPLGENEGKSEYRTFRYLTLQSFQKLQMQIDSASVKADSLEEKK